jgi:hypothetical protein
MSKILHIDVISDETSNKWKTATPRIIESIERVLNMEDKYQIAASILSDDLDAITINVRLLPSDGVENV